MNVMEVLTQIWDYSTNNKETVALIVTFLATLIQAIRTKLQAKEALMLLMNVLKDENKMTPQGQFQDATVQKLDQIAKTAQSSQSAVEEVKAVIDKVNVKVGIKIGSYKGKPIYLEDLSRAGIVLKAAWDIVRGIFRR